jgi:hypothetical protein
MTPDPLHADSFSEQTADCAAFVSRVHAVLDRELGLDALDDDHLTGCRECRELATAARTLFALPYSNFTSSTGLTERITIAVQRDYFKRRARRRLGVFAIVASLLAGLMSLYYWSRTPETLEVVNTPSTPAVVSDAPPPRMTDQFAEAGSAVVSITLRARERTVTPTRTFIPSPETLAIPTTGSLPGMTPATESLAGMPEAARSGIEPITDKTRRAVNLFLRDVGIGSTPKSKL